MLLTLNIEPDHIEYNIFVFEITHIFCFLFLLLCIIFIFFIETSRLWPSGKNKKQNIHCEEVYNSIFLNLSLFD